MSNDPRAVADAVAGASLDTLLANQDAANRAVEAWAHAYAAACAQAAGAVGAPMSVKETQVYLGCSETKVRDLVRRGTLRTVPGLGAMVRIVRADVVNLGNAGAA